MFGKQVSPQLCHWLITPAVVVSWMGLSSTDDQRKAIGLLTYGDRYPSSHLFISPPLSFLISTFPFPLFKSRLCFLCLPSSPLNLSTSPPCSSPLSFPLLYLSFPLSLPSPLPYLSSLVSSPPSNSHLVSSPPSSCALSGLTGVFVTKVCW